MDPSAMGRVDPVERLTPDPAYAITRHEPYDWIGSPHLVAHGMGAIRGKRVTNSFEAFEANYDLGYRIFEVDLVPSKDGKLVARHDWMAYMYGFLGQRVENPYRIMTEREFKELPIHGHYTPLTLDDIVAIMKAYPDIYVVTDTKSSDPGDTAAAMVELQGAIGKDDALEDRLIVQIYNEAMLRVVRDDFGFRNLLYTFYQLEGTKEQALDFARDNGVRVVAVPDAMWSRSLAAKARKRGLTLGVYTVNGKSRAEELFASGVRLVWSDSLEPTDAR